MRTGLLFCFPGLLLFASECAAQPNVAGKDRHGDPLPEGAVARIGTLRYRLGAGAYSLAYSPDGKHIAVGGARFLPESPLIVFEAATGKAVHRLTGHAHVVRTVAFSADGKLLASGGGDGRLAVWDLATGKRLWLSKQDVGDTATFLGDSKTLAADENYRDIRLFDATTGKAGLLLKGHQQRIFGVAASPDGKRLASCSMDGSVRLWDPSSGQEVARFTIAEKYGLNVAFSADGKWLACVTYTGAVYLYEVAAAKERWRTPAGAQAVCSVAFSQDGTELFAIRQEIRVLDVATGKERRRLPMPREMYHLALAPDRQSAATISNDGEVRLFDLQTGKAINRFEGHAQLVRSLSFSPDGKVLATASDEDYFRLWDPATGKPLQVFHHRAGAVTFVGDGRTLATTAQWEGISLWEVATSKRTRQIGTDHRAGNQVAFLPGDPPVLACDLNGALTLTDPASGKVLPQMFRVEVDTLYSPSLTDYLAFAVAADGKTIAVNTKIRGNGPIVVWDARTGKELLRTAVSGSVLALSGDGRLLAVSTNEGVVVVDGRTGKEKRRLAAGSLVTAAAFTPDGRMLATASAEGSIRLWETTTWQQRHRFPGHTDWIRCLAFSPDGSRLASGSDDRTALVWEVFR
jgi:WD40 repeat protein